MKIKFPLLDADPTYDYAELSVAMQHLYHHLNTAWNARDESPERVAATSARMMGNRIAFQNPLAR